MRTRSRTAKEKERDGLVLLCISEPRPQPWRLLQAFLLCEKNIGLLFCCDTPDGPLHRACDDNETRKRRSLPRATEQDKSRPRSSQEALSATPS